MTVAHPDLSGGNVAQGAVTKKDEGLWVRQSTGLVREASMFDGFVYSIAVTAPVGLTLAWSVFFALTAFPGSDLVAALLISVVLNAPLLLMMALLVSSMPRTGADYVWVSRLLSPAWGVVSNFGIGIGCLLGTAFFARFFPVFAVGPILVALGVQVDNQTLIDWGQRFQTDNLWILIAGIAITAAVTWILVGGIRRTFLWTNIFWIIASAGTFLAFLLLLFGNHDSFVSNFNAINQRFGGGTYDQVIAAANAGSAHADPFLFSALLPTVFIIQIMFAWNWMSAALGGELKGATVRRRHMVIMYGAFLWNVFWTIVGIVLLYNVVGYNFMLAVNTAPNAQYMIPAAPFYQFIASIVFNNAPITVLVMVSFLFWAPVAMVGNLVIPARSAFAWAFDRILPERVAYVSERYHSPVGAILPVVAVALLLLVWSTLSATVFSTVLALAVLATVTAVIVICVAAFAFPIRHREFFLASPANVSVLGVPLIQILAVLSAAGMLFLIWLTLAFPALAMGGNSANWWWIPGWIVVVILIGLGIFYVSRSVRRRQGINIDLLYSEIPPE